MKQKRSEIIYLLSLLIVFGGSLCFLHRNKKTNKKIISTSWVRHTFDDMTLKHAYSCVQGLFSDKIAPEAIAHSLVGVSIQRAEGLVDWLLKDQKVLATREEKLRFLFALTATYQSNILLQYRLLDLIYRHDFIHQGEPIISVALHTRHKAIIPLLCLWMQDKKVYEEISLETCYHFINTNDIDGLYYLVSEIGMENVDRATKLLMHAAYNSKDSRFIDFLVKGQTPISCVWNNRNKCSTQLQECHAGV